MVLVCANLVIPDLVALLDAETGILQGFRDFGGENISAILRGTHEVIQDEVPVVAFGDMLWHFLMLPLRSPKQSFEEKGFYHSPNWFITVLIFLRLFNYLNDLSIN